MAFLTGKANIVGGYIYSSEFCPIILGKNNLGNLTNHSRISELYCKNFNNNGTLSINDSLNNNRICLDNNNNLKFSGETMMNKLLINSENNTDYICKFNSNGKTLSIEGICNINGSCDITGCCNINGKLLIDNISFIDQINQSIDTKFNNLNIISLKTINDVSGLFIKTSDEQSNLGEGIIWKNNKFNILKNIELSNNTLINNNNIYEYGDLHINHLISNSLQTNNINLSIYKYDLNTITDSITNIDTTNHSISQFSNGNQTIKYFNLLNPSTTNSFHHQLIADESFNGIVIIEGNFIFPDGTINNENVIKKKIKLDNIGSNILLTYINNYWYITNGGIKII